MTMDTIKRASCGMLICWLSIFSTSCKPSSSQTRVAASDFAKSRYVRICEVRQDRHEYVGKVIRFHVTYKSDHMFYSYLFDQACQEQKTLNVVHPIRTHGDVSVTKFFHEQDERCKKIGTTVCPVEVNLDVEALVSELPDGSLIAEFKHVSAYNF